MLGVHVEAGPSTQEIITAFERCEGWSRNDRKQLAYLAIFTGHIEGRKYSTPTRVSLARLVMELVRFENYPWGRVAFKVLMDSVKGKDISGYYTINGFAQAIQTRVIKFVQKDIGEMFPKWEFDAEETPAENIIKLVFVKKPWKWTMDCWEVTGIWVNTKPAVVSQAKKKVVKEDSTRPRKKARKEAPAEASEEAPAEASEEVHSVARSEVTTTVGVLTKEDIKTMFKDIVDAMREWFGTCLKEIKYLSERVEVVEKKVGITTKRKGTLSQNTTSPPKPTIGPGSESVNGTNAGRKSLPEDKGPDVPADASSSKDKAPESSLVLLDKNQPTLSDLQKEDARYQEKRDVALTLCRAKNDRIRKLAASQQSPYTANSTAKVIIPNKNLYPGYNPFAPIDKKKLKKLADWLKTCPHYRTPLDKKPRKSRTWWYHILRISLEWLEDCHIDVWINVLRKRMCFLDHLFALQWRFNYKDFKDSESDQNSLGRRLPVNYINSHWIAMWISIPKRHIVVWDSICSSISPEELDVVMEHFLYMVPYLLVECTSLDEQHLQYSLEPFTYERLTNIPQARAGDCGVYTLKYIKCHALGMPFSKKDFAKPNGKTMRDKMAVDIFKELPDAYEFENKDNDANLGAYEG
ncbi:hypothetical protein DY000_02004740 [Brassica cretica]|uniref:Ubiquitin-like protease family profile domain-containing protein n=1 Tax=Brassica cretica TaxID=69181 RepID=A0ABQ7BXC5_BRACR|nr:hypothetical protein DY000_02004740 [Brassica cretica]